MSYIIPVQSVASVGSLKQALRVNRSMAWLEQVDPSHLPASTAGRVDAPLYVAVINKSLCKFYKT